MRETRSEQPEAWTTTLCSNKDAPRKRTQQTEERQRYKVYFIGEMFLGKVLDGWISTGRGERGIKR